MEVVLSRPIRTSHLSLLPLHEMLVAGGDERLRRDPDTDLNRYGCPVLPDPGLLALGSSTASPISESAYLAAKLLHLRLQACLRAESAETVFARESAVIKAELIRLCQIGDLPGLELQLAASGTDAHQAAARRIAGSSDRSLHTLTVESAETGSFVVAAMSSPEHTVSSVALRSADGAPRHADEIDADFTRQAEQAIAAGKQVLLVLADITKTGLLAPSPELATSLRLRWPGRCDVLIDACQLRFSPNILRRYLELDFMVALTGSKFIGGPSFSGALLIPAAVRERMPSCPTATESPNFGLLLRWQAALDEFRTFSQIPQAMVSRILSTFEIGIKARLSISPWCVPLPTPALGRPFPTEAEDWSHIQSIFPILLLHPESGEPLTLEQTRHVYQLLQHDLGNSSPHTRTRFLLGQPVACGSRNGVQIGALRLCASARMVATAAIDAEHARQILQQSLAAFDKIEYIAAAHFA